jgi:hypothetical protein
VAIGAVQRRLAVALSVPFLALALLLGSAVLCQRSASTLPPFLQ